MNQIALRLVIIFICTEIYAVHRFSDEVIGKKLSEEKKITISGFTAYHSYFDSRQIVSLHEKFLLFYPQRPRYDELGNDINAHAQYDASSFITRVIMDMQGPDTFNAHTGGLIESDFVGVVDGPTTAGNGNIDYRVRMAYFFLEWDKIFVLAGLNWHPLFQEDCFPRVISYNIGTPFEPEGWHAQAKLVGRISPSLEMMFAMATEVGFTTNGVDGFTPEYLQWAILPQLIGHLRYYINDRTAVTGSLYFKRVVPRLVTDLCFKTDESVNGVGVQATASLNYPTWSTNMKVIYVENGTDLTLIGGYAVATRDKNTGMQTYKPTRAISTWIDTEGYYNDLKPGIFIGFSKNLGTSSNLYIDPTTGNPILYVQLESEHLDYVGRISPRIKWNIKGFELSGELEYTFAAYGSIAPNATIFNSKIVNNARILIAGYYFF